MVGGLYAAAAGVLIVAVLAVAYGTQAPSLAVAEFAPAARLEVDAPPTTASVPNGGGPQGRAGRPTTTSTPSTTAPAATDASGAGAAPTTRMARARPCVGNPPRQTEDPMSPSCLATIFEGDNGGDTGRGITATEIRIGIPGASGAATDPTTKVVNALFAYFNQRFELYGRRLVPIFNPASSETPEGVRAIATDLAARNVFAAITGIQEWGAELPTTMLATFAHYGVVSIARGGSSWLTDRIVYDTLHPYAWSVYQSSEDVLRNLAALGCSLVGRPARNAGDANMQTRTRSFAILGAGQQAPQTRVLQDALEACGGTAPRVAQWVYNSGPTSLQTAMERLRSGADSATTVICVCDTWAHTEVFNTSGRMGFRPEWIITPTVFATGYDEFQTQSNRQANLLAPPIRLGSGPRLLAIQDRPWFGALQTTGLLAQIDYTVLGMAEFVYPELLVLATGVQGAGPRLNADTFAQALMSTQFPNPGAGAAPYWQPSAGFGPGDHSLYDDYNVGWWSDAATAVDPLSSSPRGSWCYLSQGARYQPGTYPADTDALLFNPGVPCR